MPGALDASVAAAMVELAAPALGHRFLNLACGSGTLCVERLQQGPAAAVMGIDIAAGPLKCADANLRAAGRAVSASLVQADAARLPFPAETAHEIVSDLPFGMVVGSPRGNESLYPAFLAESGRVAARGATLVVFTAARRLFEAAVGGAATWAPVRRIPVRLPTRAGVIQPCIYVLKRV